MFKIGRRYLGLFTLATLVALAIGAHATRAQSSAPDYQLNISGEVERSLKLGPSDLAKLPRRSVKARDHGGAEATFEGVALVDVLQLAGVKFGEGLKGKNLALYLVVEAADDYRAVFALPELDPAYNDRVMLLADRRDGAKLDDKEGPLRVVVPGEKRQARWVRQVRSLIIKRAS
jgi:DMSO/TMAO reductase YedYZ molybdopterin-dependent catalytic subunit